MSCEPVALPDELASKLQRCLPLLEEGSILLLGDSMLARFQDYGTGRGLLDPTLFANIAIGGSTTNHWIYLLQSRLLNDSRMGAFKKIIVMLGTNNLPDLGQSAHDISLGLSKVINLLRDLAPSSEICFISILPRWDLNFRETLLPDIEYINRSMESVCHVLYPPLTDRCCFADDDLHLNRAGYELFFQFLKDNINQ